MTKKRNKTVNLWNSLHLKLQEMKKKGKSISETVDICLNTKMHLDKLLEQEGIGIGSDILYGMKTTNVSLPEDTLQKINRIKEFIPSFSGSVVTNLCLIFPSFTVDSILQKIKGEYFLKKHPENKKEDGGGNKDERKEPEKLEELGKLEKLVELGEPEKPKEPEEPIPKDVLERVQEIAKNYK